MSSVLKRAVIGSVLFLIPTDAFAATDAHCLEAALVLGDTRHEVYLLRKAAEISAIRPDLEEIATLQAEVERTGFLIFNSRRSWLWRTSPERFVDAGAFLKFGPEHDAQAEAPDPLVRWQAEDHEGWLGANTDHANLLAKWDILRQLLETHPKSVEFNDFWSGAEGKLQFLDLAVAQSAASSADREAIAACF